MRKTQFLNIKNRIDRELKERELTDREVRLKER